VTRRPLSLAIGAVAILLLAGCGGSLPSTDLPATREVSPALEFPDLRDYRGEIDCKMKQSGLDQVKLAEIAHDAQIDFIFLGDYANETDADFGVAGFTSDILFISGAAFKMGNDGAEIVGLNLHHPIEEAQNAGDIIGKIHEQGAVAMATNISAFSSPADYALADAIEIYNPDRGWNSHGSLGTYLRAVFFSADRLFASLDIRPAADFANYDRMTSGARVVLLAGIGAAPNLLVMGTKVGTFEQLFEIYTTHIVASERQTDPIVDALKHGHAYVSFDLLGYVPNFAFFAQTGDRKIMMGDEVAMAPGLKLQVEMPAPADKVVIIGSGVEAASTSSVSTFAYVPTGPGAYRVEAYRGGHPWIYSNPIYVR
jgi:hypothetical protein